MSMATGEYVSVSSQADTEQAALASACSFSIGAVLPLTVTVLLLETWLIKGVVLDALVSLAILGGLAARVGAAKIFPGVLRVTLWSALAMAITSIVGILFGGV